MSSLLRYALLPLISLVPVVGQVTFDFSTPVQTAPTQTPGKWYVDRFAPSGFVSPITAPDGTPFTLKESIAGSDHQTYPGNAFYNTQGRKLDLPANTTSMTIKLFVPSSFASVNGRVAGFWATAFDASNNVGDFPIIEFQGLTTSDQMGPGYYQNTAAGFYGYNNLGTGNSGGGSWDFIGLPAGFTYDSEVQLTITIIPGNKIVYTVSTALNSVSVDSPMGVPDTYLGNVILQGYNYGSNYDIFWGGGSVADLVQTNLFFYWFFAS